MEEEDPVRSALFKARAKEFAGTFIYWFDDEGKALPFGRSMTYRFAQAAFWSMSAMLELDVLPPGVLKGLIGRHMEQWLRQPIYDNGGVLSIGYAYPNLNMSEGYNASGSPYWAFKTFALLALPAEHEFWKVKSEPLPKLEKQMVIPECNMLINRRGMMLRRLRPGNIRFCSLPTQRKNMPNSLIPPGSVSAVPDRTASCTRQEPIVCWLFPFTI